MESSNRLRRFLSSFERGSGFKSNYLDVLHYWFNRLFDHQHNNMSFFGGGNSAPVNQGPNVLALAKIEAEITTDLFNKISSSCFKKCVPAYYDGELSVGEMACLDRCVSKYMQAHQKVGDVLNSFEQQMKAQEQMGMNMNPSGQKFGPGKM